MSTILDKIANPLNFYKKPHDVEHDQDLSVEDKIKILTNWLDDINLRQIAEAENMPMTYESKDNVAAIERLLRKYLPDKPH